MSKRGGGKKILFLITTNRPSTLWLGVTVQNNEHQEHSLIEWFNIKFDYHSAASYTVHKRYIAMVYTKFQYFYFSGYCYSNAHSE